MVNGAANVMTRSPEFGVTLPVWRVVTLDGELPATRFVPPTNGSAVALIPVNPKKYREPFTAEDATGTSGRRAGGEPETF
jgi:hypothetical protein